MHSVKYYLSSSNAKNTINQTEWASQWLNVAPSSDILQWIHCHSHTNIINHNMQNLRDNVAATNKRKKLKLVQL